MKVESVVIFCALLLCGSISAGLYAQSSDSDQRLVGAWICEGYDSPWIFNSDGTGINGGGMFFLDLERITSFKYMALNGIIIIASETASENSNRGYGGSYAISPDGRTLVLKFDAGEGLWLRKKS